ncbi:MAG: putative DNA-binding domain-containing protein [Nevskia sp.]|nr:putative DNA-binding domain-containing protein [Nevskia sp.]
MSAPRLAQLQRRFQAQILRGGGDLQALVHGDAGAAAEVRLAVYTQAYRLRLLEVLGNDYPALRRLLGKAGFERAGKAYIDAHPSDTPSVRWFGRHLPSFLEQRAEPLAAELARFEWCKGLVFDAPDEAPLALSVVAALAAAQWPAMCLLPRACVQRLELHWNVPALFQAAAGGRRLPRPRRAAAAVHWLLWRDGAGDIRWRSLRDDEAAAWDLAARGSPFAAVCERLCQWVEADSAPLHAAGLLKGWLADALLAGLEQT